MPLLLLPNLLSDTRNHSFFLPASVDLAVSMLDGLIAESEGGGRSFLKRFQTKKKAHLIPIALLNKHTAKGDFDFLLEPVIKGETWGIVSDAGLPCLADPGSALVLRAQQLKLPIEAFTGPSSITLSLMLSGLTGQRFTFHGYIAKESQKREFELKNWEKLSRSQKETQIFIEAPYRNLATFQSCLKTLSENTLFCVAFGLTMPEQKVITFPIRVWKKEFIDMQLSDKPAVFLFQAT